MRVGGRCATAWRVRGGLLPAGRAHHPHATPCAGGVLLPLLGAMPDALIILNSGLNATPEQAKEEIAVGMWVGWQPKGRGGGVS